MGMDAASWQARRAAVLSAVATGALPPLPLNDARSWAVMGDMDDADDTRAAAAAGTAEAPTAPAAGARTRAVSVEQAAVRATSPGCHTGGGHVNSGGSPPGDSGGRSNVSADVTPPDADECSGASASESSIGSDAGPLRTVRALSFDCVLPREESVHAFSHAGTVVNATCNGTYDSGGGAAQSWVAAPATAAAELRQRRRYPIQPAFQPNET